MEGVQELAGRLMTGAIAPIPCPTEGDFHALWVSRDINALDLFTAAATGGALADRLPWVFMSGYQSTIRRAFPSLAPEPGWAAFVNTEDPRGALPGTRLQADPNGFVLSGWKTWVAGAGHVDRLLVSSRQNEPPFVCVRRDAPGVHIEPGAPKEYLTELVQGKVEFRDVRIGTLAGAAESLDIFRATESCYVRAALAAFIVSHTVRLGGPPTLLARALSVLLSWASILAFQLPSKEGSVATLGAANEAADLAEEFEYFIRARDPGLHRLWMKDRPLPRGSTERIAARAAGALGVVESAV